MACKRLDLYQAYMKLTKLGFQCSESTTSECQCGGMTVNQIQYLRLIDENSDMTFSMLAELTSNSKPTITQMINRFIDWDCVYKEKSENDKRVFYIRLTPKGKRIARAQETVQIRIIECIENCLTEDEIAQFIVLLNKLSL